MAIEPENPASWFADMATVNKQVAVLEQLPPPVALPDQDRPFGFPLVLAGPWSRGAREIQVQRDLRAFTDEFIDRGMRNRSWQPSKIRSISEIVSLGHLITDETGLVTKTFWRTELRIGDYTKLGMEMVRDGMARMKIIAAWGNDEANHAVVDGDGLLQSGVITEAERIVFEREALANHWDPAQHVGLNEELGYLAYGAQQEGETEVNYGKLIAMVRRDYGLPPEVTDEERKRGYLVGLCEPLSLVRRDEVAHHMSYVNMLMIYSRYFPEKVYGALKEVQRKFHMPSIELIPESPDVVKPLYGGETQVEGIKATVASYRKQADRVNKRLGLEDRRALAVANSGLEGITQHLDPELVMLQPDGKFVVLPEGAFEQYREIIDALKAETAA